MHVRIYVHLLKSLHVAGLYLYEPDATLRTYTVLLDEMRQWAI
jgi:hypothetical protein